jgi:hypothetical protein
MFYCCPVTAMQAKKMITVEHAVFGADWSSGRGPRVDDPASSNRRRFDPEDLPRKWPHFHSCPALYTGSSQKLPK